MESSHLTNGVSCDSSLVGNGSIGRKTHRPVSYLNHHEAGLMPIAVVGMACRFPGGSSNPEKLWEMLVNKRNGWSPIKADRFTQSSFEHPSSSVSGTFNSKGAHFLEEDISLFDAPAFNISPLEAKAMDPQMRLQLEVTYEALESGGIKLEQLAGSKTGVYIGVFSDDYSNMMSSDPESLPSHHVTGTGKAIFANRISYYFDLKGPSFSLDTGCSASLVALHQACQSIRSGETSQAIVGGTNLILYPKTMMALGGLGFLSDHGRCYSFDSRGSGYGRGEGVASLFIKPLTDAIADGDPIRAIIRNTAVNQDGRTAGLTMPNRDAQISLMQEAYAQARIDPQHTQYVEAHGTGTKIGDPIEVEAIGAALAGSGHRSEPLFVGSIKSNIGHLESASGLAGMIKTILCLEKSLIPPNADFENANVDLNLEQRYMKVSSLVLLDSQSIDTEKIAKKLQPWPVIVLRRASLNSFGYGGTNAHVILDAYDNGASATCLDEPPVEHDTTKDESGRKENPSLLRPRTHSTDPKTLFLISHRTRLGVLQLAQSLKPYITSRLGSASDHLLDSMAYTLNSRRTALQWRAVARAASPQEFAEALDSKTLGPKRIFQKVRLAFIFTGQGAQWYGMGRELISSYPTFRSDLMAADMHFRSLGASWSLMDELLKPIETSLLNSAAIGQPLCTTIQCALVNLLESWNVKPSSVTGHSSGEIAAAYACHSLTMASALTISYYRGSLVSTMLEQNSKLRGAMIAARLSEADAETFIRGTPAGRGKAVVACVNSPESVTISGDRVAIMHLQSMLEARQIFVRRLKVGTAYHSHHMATIADSYLAALEGIPKPKTNDSIAFFSSVSGGKMSGDKLDAAYWVKNMVSQVKFSSSLRKLCEVPGETESVSQFGNPALQLLLEIGPHGALAGPVKQTLGATGGRTFQHVPTLSRGWNAVDTMLTVASQLVVSGYPIDLQAVNNHGEDRQPRVLADLPSYPWDHSTSYWHESRLSVDYRKRSAPRHPLLGAPTPDFNRLEPSWRNIIRVAEIPWVRGHVIQSNIIYPAAGYVAMAIEASLQHSRLIHRDNNHSGYKLKNISIAKPLLIPDNAEGIETQFVLRPYNESAYGSSDIYDEFRVFSYTTSDGWNEHCRGLILRLRSEDNSEVEGDRERSCDLEDHAQIIDMARAACRSITTPARLYQALEATGINFQGAFRCLEDAAVDAHQSLGHFQIPDTASSMPGGIERSHVIHPSTLDACIQMTFPTLMYFDMLQTPMVPTFINELTIAGDLPRRPGDRFLVHTYTRLEGKRSFKSDITARGEDATPSILPQIKISGLVCTAIPGGANDTRSVEDEGKCHRFQWEKYPALDINEAGTRFNGPGAIRKTDVRQLTMIHPECPSSATETLISCLSSTLGERLVSISANFNDIVEAGLNGKICICLSEIDSPTLNNCNASQWHALSQMLSSASQVLWVTAGGAMDVVSPGAGLIVGLARTSRLDNNALRLTTFDIDAARTSPEETAKQILAVLEGFGLDKASNNESDVEYAERSGQIYVPRIVEDPSLQRHLADQTSEPQPQIQSFFQPGRHLRLAVATPGLLDSLHFVEDTTATIRLAAHELRMQPMAYGVNFRDVMIALGQLESTSLMSSEHSGIVTEIGENLVDHFQVGDRICCCGGSAFASSVTVNGDAVQRIPDDMTFETAASIPIVFATAYYGLVQLARLQKGESILIHSAAGGVGQAAVMLAKHLGATIFVTVGSKEKKDLVMGAYQIPEDHVFSSRQTTFAAGIKRLTGGKGVDVVLNSIAGEAFHKGVGCLAKLGRFIEIGKRDILRDSRLDLGSFNKSITFASVDLTILFEYDPALAKRMLSRVFALLAEGSLHPVQPLNVFSVSEIERAFRLIQAGKHTGKVVLKANQDTSVKVLSRSTALTTFVRDASYVLVGGLGGLGRAICRWMASRNCKNIIALSRSGMESPHASSLKDELEGNGVKLTVYACDIGHREQLQSVLDLCAKSMPPIKGVIQSAMVIRDNMIDKMTLENYQDALRPKVQGTLNIHEALMGIPLDFFLLLSSCVGIIGNNGQANYASACTFQDAFARYRSSLGMPTRSLDLGMIEGAGYVSENADVLKFLTAQGFRPVKVDELLAAIDYAITQPIRNTDDSQLILGLTGPDAENHTLTFADAKFSHIRSKQRSAAESNAKSQPTALKSQLKNAESIPQIHNVIRDAFIAQLSKVLVVPLEDVDPSHSVSSYGGDSLSAVELRNWIVKDLGVSMGVMEILSGKSINTFTSTIAERYKSS